MAGGSASLSRLQVYSSLEGLETHVRQMTVMLGVWIGAGISVVGVKEDNSLGVGPER